MVKNFLYLEILDPEINYLVSEVNSIVCGAKEEFHAHLTVRGPYSDKLKDDEIRTYQETMKYDVLRIGGVGRFVNGKEHTVFLRIDSPNLRQIWWKPDYPIERYGYNPHLSVYRGKNGVLAEQLEAFLEKENLCLLCERFRLVGYMTKQLDMFPLELPKSAKMSKLLDDRKVSVTFLSRLEKLITASKRLPEAFICRNETGATNLGSFHASRHQRQVK